MWARAAYSPYGWPYLEVGHLANGDIGRGYIKFMDIGSNSGSVPRGSVIRRATLSMFQNRSGDSGHNACGDSPNNPSPDNAMSPLVLNTLNAGWSQNNISWAYQPPVRAAVARNYATLGNNSVGGGCGAGWTNEEVAGPVNDWVNGNNIGNNGFMLGTTDESHSSGFRQMATSESSTPPHLDVTYSAIPYVSGWSSSPSVDLGDGTRLVSAHPQLNATVVDPDQQTSQLAANFQVAENGALVKDQNAGWVNTGGTVSSTVDLLDGHSYLWNARAYYVDGYGQVIGNFLSNGQPIVVDGQNPSAPKVSSTDVRRDGWIAPNSNGTLSAAGFSFTATDNQGVAAYSYQMDGGPWSAATTVAGYTWSSIPSGWHTLFARAHDVVGNIGPTESFSFGVGSGVVGAARTWRNLLLTPGGSPDKTGVTYTWRPLGTGAAWSPPLPTADVTFAGAGPSPRGTHPAGWPVSPTTGTFQQMVWNAAATLQTAGVTFGGLIQVQACYTSTSGGPQCAPQTVQLDRTAFGGSYATAPTGPGKLSLATGDLDVTATDASTPGWTAPLTFGRDLTTLLPGGTRAEILTPNQQGAETDTTGFTGGAASLGSSPDVASTGIRSLKITSDGSTADNSASVGGDAGALRLGLSPGHTYTFAARVYVPAAGGTPLAQATSADTYGRGLRIMPFWRSGAGAYHLTTSNAPTAVNTWTAETVTFAIPPDATEAAVRLYNGAAVAGQSVYYDSMSLREVNPGTTNATRVLGPGWNARLPTGTVGAAAATVEDQTASTGAVLLTDANGAQTSYLLDGKPGETVCSAAAPCTYYGVAEAAYDGSRLTQDLDPAGVKRITLAEVDGTTTVWTLTGSRWQVVNVTETGRGASTGYRFDDSGRLTDTLAPSPPGVTCALNPADATSRGLVPGCRDLALAYTDPGATRPGDTPATWGPYPGQLAEVDSWTTDPATGTVTKVVVASYAYDSSGHLRAGWDPRITPVLKTTYTYTGTDPAARLSAVTPPGLSPTTLGYDPSGRLSTVTRPNPAGGTLTQTVAYDVARSGPGLPTVDGSGTNGDPAPAAWGQTAESDLPVTATAVFGPDHPPANPPTATDWPYAGVSYVNNDGRATNTAAFGAGAWQLATTWYDQASGNVTATLSPRNRAMALNKTYPGGDAYVTTIGDTTASGSATRASLLSTVTTYSPDGIDALTVTGPVHKVVRADGSREEEVRSRTVTAYDEGKPAALTGPRHLPTTTTSGAVLVAGDGSFADTRTTLTGYDPVDGAAATGPTSGWTLHTPTKVTQKVTGGDLVRTTVYDTDGRAVQTRMPRDPGNSGAPSTTQTAYYTADATSGTPACDTKPAFAGWTCQTRPGSTTTTPGPAGPLPALLTSTVTAYTRDGQPTTSTETSGSTTRTAITGYDPAERRTSSTLTTSGDTSTPVDPQYAVYDPATGLTTCLGTAPGCTGSTVTTGYDPLGRTVSSTDADGATTTTTYDPAGRVAATNEAKTGASYAVTTSYTYDGTDNQGRVEHRGRVTSVNTGMGSAPSTFTASYDENGALDRQRYPNIASDGTGATVARNTYDTTGYQTNKDYDFGACTGCWYFNRSPNAHGQTAWTGNITANPAYSYDGAGRLASTFDQSTGTARVFKRRYAFDANSNRTALATDDTAYGSLVSASRPSAWWRFNDAAGQPMTDTASPASTAGTYPGTGMTYGVAGATPGETNRGAGFDGTNTASTPNTTAVTLNGQWTISFWLKAAAKPGGYPNFLRKSWASSPSDGWKITQSPNGQVIFSRGGTSVWTAPNRLGDNTWHQIFFRYDGTTLSAGSDGRTDSTTAVALPADTSQSGLTIGEGEGNPFSLDELAVHPTALTDDQIAYQDQAAGYGSYAQSHSYDEADRLTDPGYGYDPLGRTTTVPGADAGGQGTVAAGTRGAVTATYYATDLVRSLSQAGTTKTYSLDPLRRTRVTTTSGQTTTTIQHYGDSTAAGSEAASWVETTGTTPTWSRNITGPDGLLAATQDKTGTPTLVLTNIEGSVVGSLPDTAGSTPGALTDSTEYGAARPTANGDPRTTAGPDKYGWLGGHRRNQDAVGDLTLMGQRLYNPALGRFLQTDPVPGGSANDYDYVNQDPVNGLDLDGQFCWRCLGRSLKKVAKAAGHAAGTGLSIASEGASFVPGPGGAVASGLLGVVSAGAYAATGDRSGAKHQLVATAISAGAAAVGLGAARHIVQAVQGAKGIARAAKLAPATLGVTLGHMPAVCGPTVGCASTVATTSPSTGSGSRGGRMRAE